ncbi:MAG: cell division protein FtsQ/DivIB [Alphaproteobacteria bacterium]|nr:cell division protein FtsQ/DivIB [Alphaproteobacteria bacterium]
MGLKPSTKNYSTIRLLKKLYRRILQLVLLIVLVLLLKTFLYDRTLIQDYVNKHIQRFSEKHGLIVEEIGLITSNQYCPIVTKSTFDQFKKRSILLVSLTGMLQHIESFDCVNRTSVTRIFPNKIKIEIINKDPIAIWQNNKKFMFITSQNDIMQIRNTKDLDKFLIVTGSNANLHTKSLLDIIKINKEIFTSIESAIRVGDRRWDIKLKTGLEIKLPEKNPEIAWSKYINLTKNPKFQNKKLKVLDLRIPNKIYAK